MGALGYIDGDLVRDDDHTVTIGRDHIARISARCFSLVISYTPTVAVLEQASDGKLQTDGPDLERAELERYIAPVAL